jgi:hypothetical protein
VAKGIVLSWRGLALAAWLLVAAAAQADPFRVEDVPVDASAEDAVVARDLAIAQGQRDGLVTLMRRLSTATALPSVANVDLDRLVVSHEIAEEQVGATRYVGRINVTYDRGEVERLLRDAGLPYVILPPGPVLVVPALRTAAGYDLWSDANPWRAAWLTEPPAGELLEISVPLGDIADLTAFGADDLAVGNAEALQQLARRYGAVAAYVAVATLDDDPRSAEGRVRLAVLAPDLRRPLAEETVLAADRPAVRLAADRAVALIEADWKRENTVRADQVSALRVEVPLVDLAGWVHIRDRLEGVPWIRRLRIDELGRRRAALTIEHIGDFPRLERALAEVGLGLSQENGAWRLRPAGGPATVEEPYAPSL